MPKKTGSYRYYAWGFDFEIQSFRKWGSNHWRVRVVGEDWFDSARTYNEAEKIAAQEGIQLNSIKRETPHQVGIAKTATPVA